MQKRKYYWCIPAACSCMNGTNLYACIHAYVQSMSFFKDTVPLTSYESVSTAIDRPIDGSSPCACHAYARARTCMHP